MNDLIARARALVFDFDGTLVDSNSIKWRGFEAVFNDFPNRLQEIMAYCRGQNHTIRGEKFRHVYDRILGLPYTPEVAEALHQRFDRATTEQIVNAPEIPGAFQFLRKHSESHITAILSSTPHDKLLYILDRRGWLKLPRYVQGAPVDKAGWLAGFQRGHKLAGSEVVFFGDMPEDAEAAERAGCSYLQLKEFPPVSI